MSYISPLSNRYSSDEMREIFSDHAKYVTWRKLWITLAKTQMDLGLDITPSQIQEMQDQLHNIDFDFVKEIERKTNHDVVAHIKAFGKAAPSAAGIIHLGATSCFVTDNADLMTYKKAFELIYRNVRKVMRNLSDIARGLFSDVTTGYTHFQPAQPTTMGKRVCLWLYDFYVATVEIENVWKNLKFRGVKGATGTQESFMVLFDKDEEKVKKLEEEIASECGFPETYPITGQTYPRIEDDKILNSLALIASAAGKFATDIKLLSHTGELTEYFESTQVGSSAMPYKQNPIKCEKICSLARYLKNLAHNGIDNHQNQWLERSLDDSANRRLTMAEAFLVADEITINCTSVISSCGVSNCTSLVHKYEHLFIVEQCLTKCVKRGLDRQDVHEILRSMCNEFKSPDDLIKKIKERFDIDIDDEIYTGRAKEQTLDFLSNTIEPYLEDSIQKYGY